ncbi:hypothetical protein THIOSC13_420003 [uncultured Thiomicrorhabdus sp.]
MSAFEKFWKSLDSLDYFAVSPIIVAEDGFNAGWQAAVKHCAEIAKSGCVDSSGYDTQCDTHDNIMSELEDTDE